MTILLDKSIPVALIGAGAVILGAIIGYYSKRKKDIKMNGYLQNKLMDDKMNSFIKVQSEEIRALRDQVSTLYKDQSLNREQSVKIENELYQWQQRYNKLEIDHEAMKEQYKALKKQYDDLLEKYNDLILGLKNNKQ